MELTHEDVLQILEILERCNVEYLELEMGGTRLVADRSGTGPAARSAGAGTPRPAAPAAPASAGSSR
ncbi:MAG: hypothetical protein ACRDPK_02620, partial [Carbonactinosporaceae bacterium]